MSSSSSSSSAAAAAAAASLSSLASISSSSSSSSSSFSLLLLLLIRHFFFFYFFLCFSSSFHFSSSPPSPPPRPSPPHFPPSSPPVLPSDHVSVVPAFQPTFAKHPLPPQVTGAVGGDITIVCNPEGAPFPEITWTRNGATLTSDGSHVTQLANGNLIIQDLSKADTGTYTCRAENRFGDANSSTVLTLASEFWFLFLEM